MKFGLAAVALLSGAGLALQVGFNNSLRARMGDPILAALGSFGVGIVGLLAYAAVLRPRLPAASEIARGPGWIWLGGLIGAAYVASSSAFGTRLGAAPWLGLVVSGQVLASVVLDHFGLIGFPVHPVSAIRLAGVALLLAGVAIVLRS